MSIWGMTTGERRLYAEKSLIFDAAELVAEAMEERGWTRKRLADALEIRASEITQRLRGKRNLTLRTLAGMLHVMDYDVRIEKVDRRSAGAGTVPDEAIPAMRMIRSQTSDWDSSGSPLRAQHLQPASEPTTQAAMVTWASSSLSRELVENP